MQGHQNIIYLRTQGRKPHIVFLNDYPCNVNWFESGDHATVSLTNDPVKTLDLRFLKGLTVSISSHDENRAKELFQRCIYHGATTVAACHNQTDKHPLKQTGWAEVFHA